MKGITKRIDIRKDISGSELRAAAKKEKHAKVCRRLLAMAHLVEGGSRPEGERIACLSNSNFRIFIKRYNDQGIEGLCDKLPTGRPAKINTDIVAALKDKILQGPGKEEGLARYRLVDMQAYLAKEHHVFVRTSSVWNYLQQTGLSWKTGRQRHPKTDAAAQETFKKNSQSY
jgi:transposase